MIDRVDIDQKNLIMFSTLIWEQNDNLSNHHQTFMVSFLPLGKKKFNKKGKKNKGII